MGATLCDTVYTALYYHHADSISSLALRAYSLAYVKSIELVYEEFAKGYVSEGEDVWLDHYGISVKMTDTTEDILEVLEEAIRLENVVMIRDRLVLRRVCERSSMC